MNFFVAFVVIKSGFIRDISRNPWFYGKSELYYFSTVNVLWCQHLFSSL